MKVAILTAFWNRPRVSRVYWAGIHRLRRAIQSQDVALPVVAAVTPGDIENDWMAKAHSQGLVVQAPNEPLAQKWNATSLAARELDPDFVMVMGSDDLLSDSLFMALLRSMRDGVQHSGIADLYLWDSELQRAGHWPGYREGPRMGGSIGLGRFYSREILESVDWRLWPDSTSASGMDGLVDEKLRARGIPLSARSCAAWGGVALDVKSKQNIWSYEHLTRTKVDPTLIRCIFPELALLDPVP